jgi:hypothetical protein
MPHLRCEHTIRKTRRDVTVHKVLTTIGRAPGNDVVLDDPMLQPTHANLMRQGTTFTLSVLAKDGDAYVNGRRVRTATLAEGDRILLGAWQLVWSERDAERAETQVGGPTQTLDLLEALVSLSADMMKDTSPERLFSALLEKLVELTRAEKGFVMVMQGRRAPPRRLAQRPATRSSTSPASPTRSCSRCRRCSRSSCRTP